MSNTSPSAAAFLRAAADHIEKHNLDNEDLLHVAVRKHKPGVIEVQAYQADAFRSWLSSLDARTVTAEDRGENHGHTVHVELYGRTDAWHFQVSYVAVAEREPAVHAELLKAIAAVGQEEPGEVEIELPEILAGTTEKAVA